MLTIILIILLSVFISCKSEIPNSTMAKYNVPRLVIADGDDNWPLSTKTYPGPPLGVERGLTYTYHRVTFAVDVGRLTCPGQRFEIGLWMDNRYPWNSKYLPVGVDSLGIPDTLWNLEQLLTSTEILYSSDGDSFGIWYPTHIKNLYRRYYFDFSDFE